MKCEICNQEFNPANFDEVFFHCFNDHKPFEATGIKGKLEYVCNKKPNKDGVVYCQNCYKQLELESESKCCALCKEKNICEEICIYLEKVNE